MAATAAIPPAESAVSLPHQSHPWSYDEAPLSPLKWLLLTPMFPLLLLLFLPRLMLLLACVSLSSLVCIVGARNPKFISATHVVIARAVYLAFGVWPGLLSVSGKPDPMASTLVFAPHTGLLDAIALLYAAGCPRPIAIRAYGRNPLISHLFRAVGGISVDLPTASLTNLTISRNQVAPAEQHSSSSTATQAVRQAIQKHKATFKSGDKPLAIAPEGTCSNGNLLLGFFSGAFEGEAAVQPILLSYAFHHYNAAAFLTSLPAHMMRGLLTPWQRVRIEFLPPCTPSADETASSFAERVRQSMACAGNLPLSDYDSRSLRKEAKALHQARRAS